MAKGAMKKMASKKAAPAKKGAVKAPMASKPTESVIVKTRRVTTPKNSSTWSYTQSEFLENVMGFCGLRKRSEARTLCEDLSMLVTESLKKGYKLPLFGLGKLYVRKTKPRVGRNPATGEPINIPAKKRIRFTPAKHLKQSILG